MKNKLLLTFVKIQLLFSIFILCSCTNQISADSLFEKTVEIECQTNNSSIYATGFFINDKGLILTNKHVIKNLSADTIINVKLKNDMVKTGQIFDISEIDDLALIKIDYESKYFQFATDFEIGTKVYALGNPKGYGLTLYEGLVSSDLKNVIYNDTTTLAIQTSIDIYDGCSGGPLFNENGKVLGIMTFRIRDNGIYIPELSFGIPSKIIINYLKNNL